MATQSKEVITFNIGSIQGGQAINTIARFAEVRFEFRSTAPNLLQQMEQTVSDVAMRIKARQDVSLVHTLIGERPAAQPVHPERIEPLVRQLLIEQGEEIISKPRSTNMNIPLSMGWPSICMGLCRCRNYHREDEYLYLDSLPLGWELLNKLTQELVGWKPNAHCQIIWPITPFSPKPNRTQITLMRLISADFFIKSTKSGFYPAPAIVWTVIYLILGLFWFFCLRFWALRGDTPLRWLKWAK